jgi:hypothetical protein
MDPDRDVWTMERVERNLGDAQVGVYQFRCNGVYVTQAVEFDQGTWDMLLHGGNNDMFRGLDSGPERFHDLAVLFKAIVDRWDESPRKPLLAKS